MAIRATDIPDPFQAIIQANADAGARGNASYQNILADAAAIQEFERREITTEEQRRRLQEFRAQVDTEQKLANQIRMVNSQRFLSDFQIPAQAAYEAEEWGRFAERVMASRDMYYTNENDPTQAKIARNWTLREVPGVMSSNNSWANMMTHTIIDMNEVRGITGDDIKPDNKSLARVAAMARDDEQVAKWLVGTGAEGTREAVAQRFGYGYERGANGEFDLFKHGTPGYLGLQNRRKRMVELMSGGMSEDNARVQIGVEKGQQQQFIARVNNLVKTNNIPRAEAQALAIEETRTQHWTTGLSLWRQSHPNASQAQETAAKNVLQFAAASKSPDDVAQFESDQAFLALDPLQRQFITNNNRIAEIEANGQIVTNPGAGSAPVMRPIATEEVPIMSAIRNSIPGTSTVADSRKTNSLNALLGGLGDPTQQKAFQRASGRGLRAFGVQLTGRGHPALTAPAGRIARVKENMIRIGNTEESIALARSKGRFEQVREDLQWFGVSEMGITQALSAMATPSTGDSPANASVSPELEANRVEANRLGAENNELARQMKQNGIPEPGTDAFDALVQGTSVAAFVRNRAADATRAQTKLLEVGQKRAEFGLQNQQNVQKEVDTLRRVIDTEGVDEEVKTQAQDMLAVRLSQLGLGGAPNQSQFGIGSRINPFPSESAALQASANIEPGTEIFIKKDGTVFRTTVQ